MGSSATSMWASPRSSGASSSQVAPHAPKTTTEERRHQQQQQDTPKAMERQSQERGMDTGGPSLARDTHAAVRAARGHASDVLGVAQEDQLYITEIGVDREVSYMPA